MATVRLNLAELAGSNTMSDFPTLFNGNMEILDGAVLDLSADSEDVDDITQTGIYRLSDSELLVHLNWGTTYAVQMKHRYQEQIMQLRYKSGGSWGAWHYQNGDVLWTNSAPSQPFSPQTVSVNLADYRFVDIVSIFDNGNVGFKSVTRIPVGNAGHLLMYYSAGNTQSRVASVNSSGVSFEHGVTPSSATADGSVIPYQIIGII